MFHSYFKYVILSLSGLLVFRKMRMEINRGKINRIVCLLYMPVFIFLSRFLKHSLIEPISSILIILILTIIFWVSDHAIGFYKTLLHITVSVATSYVIYIIASAFVSILMILTNIDELVILGTLLIGIFQLIVMVAILRHNPNSHLGTELAFGGIGIILSSIVFIIYGIYRDEKLSVFIFISLFFGIILCLTGLMYWIHKEYIYSYNYSLQRDIINEQDGELQSLNKIHDNLTSRAHDDNKRIAALQQALQILAFESFDVEASRKALGLLKDLDALSLEIYNQFRGNAASTGVSIVDAVIDNLVFKAQKSSIKCTVNVVDINNFIEHNSVITSNDFAMLIADLMENAIISIIHSLAALHSIRVEVAVLNGVCFMKVCDTGLPFEMDVLLTLGLRKVTTHANHGGSGLGYMNIFKVLNKANASLEIEEYRTKNRECTKAISVWFDGKHEYRIKSYRSKELKKHCMNPNIIFISDK